MRFNPPPGWPPAPEGWRPPAGWQPDRSWPPVPPGWRLWVEEDSQPTIQFYPQAPRPPAPRKSSVIGRTLLRTTIFAGVACIVGATGDENFSNPSKTNPNTFSNFVTAVLVGFIYFWGLRVLAALLELYITRRHSRRWTFWPHGLALATALFAIAGNEAHPGHSPLFHKVVSIQAATLGLFYYLFCALVYLIIASIAILIIELLARWKRRGRPSVVPESASGAAPQATTASDSIRSRIVRLYKTRNRDAAVLALSIVTALASLIQGLDVHDIARTALALAAGIAGLYGLYKLPNAEKGPRETTALNDVVDSGSRRVSADESEHHGNR
jgi:hypothetical protein